MKNLKTLFSAIVAIVMTASCCFMTACGNDGNGSGSEQSSESNGLVNGKAVVTFDSNLEGTQLFSDEINTVAAQTVEPGGKVVRRALVVKSSAANPLNLGFKDWCVDKDGTTPWDFDAPVEKSMTLYAKWEARCRVTYYIGSNVPVTENLFAGETAPLKDSEAGWKKIKGWYTDQEYKNPYNFDTPVTSNLDLYADVEKSVYISAARMEKFNVGYSVDADYIGSTTVKTVGEGDSQYAEVHFAQTFNNKATWITYGDLNERINDYQNKTDRFGDVLTLTYKNLGEATHFRFYYVVGYDKEGGFQYSSITYGQPVGGWNIMCEVEIRSNMQETDDWATVSINLVEATKVAESRLRFESGFDATVKDFLLGQVLDGYVSEWGTSDIICNVRFDACKYAQTTKGTEQDFDFENNILLVKSIEYGPLTSENE